MQDVFIGLFKNKDSANKIGSPVAYLYVILKNKILDWHRHNLVHKKYEEYTSHAHIEADNSMQEWIETRELEKMLNSEIEKLPPQCRNVFKLSRQTYLRILRPSLLQYKKMMVLIF